MLDLQEQFARPRRSSAAADRLRRQQNALTRGVFGSGKSNAMIGRDFLDRGLTSCKRSVNGLCRGFLLLDQGVGRRLRRRRMHRRCIGCGENTRLGCWLLSANSTSDQRRRPDQQIQRPTFSCSAGIAFSRPGRALFDCTARKDESRSAASSAAARRA